MIYYMREREGNPPNQKGQAMSNIIVFDTETTSLDKPFCYDVGYVVLDTERNEVIKQNHFVIEQTWHNLPLFESAYYKEKRQLYVQLMRARKAQLVKWGYATQALLRDIQNFEVSAAYAYNSDFDEKVFSFNCDWFKTINPFDNVPIFDIWGYASQCITNTKEYRAFCEKHERFTDTGNYKGSAEVVYQFITDDPDFEEAHMGLYDSQIEAAILMECLNCGGEMEKNYRVNKILPRRNEKPFTVKVNGVVIYEGMYVKKYTRNDIYSFTEKGE